MKTSSSICLVLILTCLLPIRAEEESSCWMDYAVYGVAGGALAVAAAPFAISAAGFTAGGVAAGSLAAGVQSAVYGGAVGTAFAGLQSAGAAGLGVIAKAGIFTAGATASMYAKKKIDPCGGEQKPCSDCNK